MSFSPFTHSSNSSIYSYNSANNNNKEEEYEHGLSQSSSEDENETNQPQPTDTENRNNDQLSLNNNYAQQNEHFDKNYQENSIHTKLSQVAADESKPLTLFERIGSKQLRLILIVQSVNKFCVL